MMRGSKAILVLCLLFTSCPTTSHRQPEDNVAPVDAPPDTPKDVPDMAKPDPGKDAPKDEAAVDVPADKPAEVVDIPADPIKPDLLPDKQPEIIDIPADPPVADIPPDKPPDVVEPGPEITMPEPPPDEPPPVDPLPEPTPDEPPEPDVSIPDIVIPEAPPEEQPDLAEPPPEPAPEFEEETGAEAPPEPQEDIGPEPTEPDVPPEPDIPPPPPPPPPPPMITEFMAINNKTLADEDKEFSDWVEIYNPAEVVQSLEGYHLTDDVKKLAKWTFPSVTIPPGRYLVVFASGKDRKDPSGKLHTSFKLDGSGEYLALVNPAMTVVSEFVIPVQAPDASYGPSISTVKSTLVVAGDTARYMVAMGEPPPDWAGAAFDDQVWDEGPTGIGFDMLAGDNPPATGKELGAPMADSVADWSAEGKQGAGGWQYGFYNRTADPDHAYSAESFFPFPRDGGGWSPTDFWNGSAWEWYKGDPPWTALGPEYAHPNGENNGAEHWAIRRYTAEAKGALFVQWHVAKKDGNGDGVTGRVFRQGKEVDQVSIAGSDTAGATRVLVLPNVAAGEAIDFALDPKGPGGQATDTSDGSVLSAAIWLMPNLLKEIATGVSQAMAGQASGLYARNVFDAVQAGPLNRLVLRMRYDDGFAAYLNGKLVAFANGPPAPAWNATASADRPLATVLKPDSYDLRDFIGDLAKGKNVLAVHGLNSAVMDPTFIVLPELDGKLVQYDAATPRYYAKPTPGDDNDDSAGELGPIVVHLTPSDPVQQGQDVPVTIQAISTGQPVLGATVTWRIMYGAEQTLTMAPGGEGMFYASIPTTTAKPGEMVRWYILATTTGGQKTRAPRFEDPLDSEQYFGTIVDDPTIVTNLPLLHWFVQNPSAAATWAGTRCSIYFGGEFYDNIRADLHGQSTSGFPKKSYDVDFNADHRFLVSPYYKRMKDINLLTNYADKSKLRNTLAYETFRDAGTGYHLAFPIRVQRNATFFEVTDFVEDADDVWLDRLGLDPEAPLYKIYDSLKSVDKAEKKNRKWEDKSDLQALITGLDKTGVALRNFIYDNVNIPAMVDFLAGLTLTSDMDCCHKNFYVYRDLNGSKEWWYLPWDVDLSFGRLWIPSKNYFDDTIYPELPLFSGGSKLTTAMYAMPEFKAMYLRRLRTLIEQVMQPPGTPYDNRILEKRVDELVTKIGADGALDFAAWPKWGQVETMEVAVGRMKNEYLTPRRNFLFNKQAADGVPGGGPIPASQGNPVILFGEFELSEDNTDEDYFTLLNPNTFAVDLSGWQIKGDVAMTFRAGTVIPANSAIYVSPRVASFRARLEPPTGGQGLLVIGDYKGVLYNPDWLFLFDAGGNPVQQP